MRGKQSIEIPVPTQGLISNVPLQKLPPNAVAGGMNVFVSLSGLLKSRLGYTPVGVPNPAGQFMGEYCYLDYSGSYVTIAATETGWQNASSSPYTNITGTPLTGGPTNFVRFTVLPGSHVEIYGCNGVDLIHSWHAGLATYTDINGANAPSSCQDILTQGGRIVALGTVESGTNFFYRIRWSEINDGTTWNALGFLDLLDVAEKIVAGVLTSNLSAVIYTTNNAYFLYAVAGDSSSCFAVEKVPGSDFISGPVSSAAITQAEGAHYWMGSDSKIWTFDGTSIYTISDPVDGFLEGSVDFANLTKVHCCYNERNRHVIFFYPAQGDGGNPLHAITYDLRLKCYFPWSFSEPITSSATVVDANQNIPLLGTNGNIYFFFTVTTDNGGAISFNWTSALFQVDVKAMINLTNFELYFNPIGVDSNILVSWYGLIFPYQTPTRIWTGVFNANSPSTFQALTPGSISQGAAIEPYASTSGISQQTGAESQRYVYLQLVLSGTVAADAPLNNSGMRFGGGTMWVNTKVRGDYGTE